MLRCNLTDTIHQARWFIKNKQCFNIVPGSSKKHFHHKVIKYPFTQVPVFSFFKLAPLISIKRKIVIRNMFRARNKLYALAPKWVNFNHIFMLGLLIRNPLPTTKFPFANSRTVATFLGTAKYL